MWLDDDDPDMVKGILFYLHTFKYPDSVNGQATHHSTRRDSNRMSPIIAIHYRARPLLP
jgi:hypothetical protein